MSFSPVFGRSSIVGVAVDRLVLVLDLELDDRDAVLELDLPMSPTLTPAMFTVWPWPGTTAWPVSNSASTV